MMTLREKIRASRRYAVNVLVSNMELGAMHSAGRHNPIWPASSNAGADCRSCPAPRSSF
jgi:hypothetical protein